MLLNTGMAQNVKSATNSSPWQCFPDFWSNSWYFPDGHQILRDFQVCKRQCPACTQSMWK